MTNRIDRLEKLGLVERQPNPEDRRGTFVALTEKGEALIDEMMAAHAANQARLLSPLSAEEQAQLSEFMARIIVGVDPDSPEFIGPPPDRDAE